MAERLTPRIQQGERDASWDWASAAALDMATQSFADWLRAHSDLRGLVREDGAEAWEDHIDALAEAGTADHLNGRIDQDKLLSHLTELALGSPATCALSALGRVAPTLPLEHRVMLTAATRIGMDFRALFNPPETQALLRDESDSFYWRAVLRHCTDHDLQSFLDEFAHVLLL